MAVNSNVLAATGSYSRRLASHLSTAGRTRHPPTPFSLVSPARFSTTFEHEKAIEEIDGPARKAVVVGHAIRDDTGHEKYWAPHAETGVFVPEDEAGEPGEPPVSSEMEKTVWVRPDDGVEQTHEDEFSMPQGVDSPEP